MLFAAAAQLDVLLAAAGQDYYTVIIDSAFMPDRAAIMEQFAANLRFPDYFGKNWDALGDCLTDLPDWLPPGKKGYLIIVTAAGATGGASASLCAETDTYPPRAVQGLTGSFETLALVLDEAGRTLHDIAGKSLKTVFVF